MNKMRAYSFVLRHVIRLTTPLDAYIPFFLRHKLASFG